MTQRPRVAICRTLGIGRATAYRTTGPRPARYVRAEDATMTTQIRAVIRQRAAYGDRRVTALVNREFATPYNRKRIRRVMALCGWTLPRSGRRRTGRAHAGLIRREGSNERWWRDTLALACWNGELVMIGVALDCCAPGSPRACRGAAASHGPEDPVVVAQPLDRLWRPVPANTLRRDDIASADLASAQAVLGQIPEWFADYNAAAPHSALGFRSPLQYRSERSQFDLAEPVS